MRLGIGAYKERFLENWDYCVTHFDVLELQDFIMPDNLENPAIIEEYKRMLEGFSGEITIHGPYLNLVPTSIDKRVKGVAEFRYLQGVAAAEKLGAKKMVIHSFYDRSSGYSGYDDFWLEENMKFWAGFLEKIKGSGVTVLLENCHDQRPETFARLFSGLGSPHFGSCLDLGHCNCLSPFKPVEWVGKVRGYYFHVTDNDGVNDSHYPPGMGNIDFGEIARELAGFSEVYLIGEAQGDIETQYNKLKELGDHIENCRKRESFSTSSGRAAEAAWRL